MATVFTNKGEELAADYFDGTASAPANWYVGWGTGAVAAAKGDVALGSESAEARTAATESQPAADTNRFVALLTSLSTQTISEAGLFDASTSGNMPIRGDFTGIPLNANDKIEFTIDLEHT
jgi:hypothetical protein